MKYQYWLSNIEGIGSVTIGKLLQYVEGAEELYRLTEPQIESLTVLTEAEQQKILASKKKWHLEAELEQLMKSGISFVSLEMEHFPSKLRYIDKPPYSIYYKGILPDEKYRSVAIVGARQCSEYGRLMAEKVSEELAKHQVEVISGMARGVDSYAHVGALRGNGKTYAVLGCGVDICYPLGNKELYQEILCSGGVLSEYPPGTQPKPQLFPARNRIISALSDIVVLIEAKERSGSLITADYALEQGRDIFACPGRATDTLSSGCNALIRQGAGIITSVESFLKDIGISERKERGTEQLSLSFQNFSLEKDESMVYSCLDLRPKSLEELSLGTGMKVEYLSGLVQHMLELGIIKEVFRNYYIRQE